MKFFGFRDLFGRRDHLTEEELNVVFGALERAIELLEARLLSLEMTDPKGREHKELEIEQNDYIELSGKLLDMLPKGRKPGC